MKKSLLTLLVLLALFGRVLPARAQWVTQTVVIKPGWNAVYLNVDASYVNLDNLVGQAPNNPIVEVWLWLAAVTPSQISPFQTQPPTSSQWASWVRQDFGPAGNLVRLVPNAGYLVHSTATTNFLWQIKGKPVAPSYAWTSTGLNFIGFPTPRNNPPTFSAFLAPAPDLSGGLQLGASAQRAPGIYRYNGGELGTNNPTPLVSFLWNSTVLPRGEAFWVDAGPALNNDYFGPFQVLAAATGGLALGDSLNQTSFTLKNVTPGNLTISVSLLASESAPAGQTAVLGTPPVLLRGALNVSNLTYSAIPLPAGASQSWTLAPKGQPGSEMVVVLGVNRAQMIGSAGAFYAGILRFSDSLQLSEVDVPLSAQVGSFSGLWVGNASVSQVANYLKVYERDLNGNPILGGTNGNYIVTNLVTGLAGTAAPFPLRLIVHSDGTNVLLLQRAFYGLDLSSNLVVATSESALDPAHLDTARRISSIGFPWTQANTPWIFGGRLGPNGTLTNTVSVSYDNQAANPFLHTYHPDHDNLDVTFGRQLDRGAESYYVTRQLILTIGSAGNDFASITRAGQSFSGTYEEAVTLTGLNGTSRSFNARGTFALNRLTPIATLTRP